MRKLLSLIMIFIAFEIQAQGLNGFDLIDNYKYEDLEVKVYFKDPLKELLKEFPEFESKEDITKHELLASYLHTNTLYVFQTFLKKKLQRSYEIKGDPRETSLNNVYIIDILESSGLLYKKIESVNVEGSFFEHMAVFQTEEGKKVVGKGIKVWGYFVRIVPYNSIKNNMNEIIGMDTHNSIPDEFLVEEEIVIEPLFDYQECGLETIKRREFTKTVYQYDSLGNIQNEFPRIESDSELYLTSTGKDISGVTTFPFFSSTDKKVIVGDKIKVTSELENIKHYLKDIEVTMDSDQVVRIEGQLIIHGYTAKGETTHYELYIAEFGKIGDCNFPTLVKFCPLDDNSCKRPRLTIEIKYELK